VPIPDCYDTTFPPNWSVLVVACGTDTGGMLAQGLARRGARVALLTDVSAEAASTSIIRIDTAFTSRQSVADAFLTARRRIGQAQTVVHSGIPATSLISSHIGTLSGEAWNAATHSALKGTIYSLQAAHDHFDGGYGSIVVFGPSVAFVGAAGLVPLCMALEAQRSLTKVAARQWGSKGIRVNWVAIDAERNYSALASAAIPKTPEPGAPPALGRVPDISCDLAAVIGLLANDVTPMLTGATINIDGGNWMLP
jgi:NAD(P)-dependent dehydrogenase (short-subunit alcohol dehydrogenase family)